MKLIQFILSIVITLCAAGLFYGACTAEVEMKPFNICFALLMLVGAIILSVFTYKELFEQEE